MVQAESIEKFSVELWLHCPDSEPTSVCCLVDVVVRSPAVEHIRASSPLIVTARGDELVEHRGEERASFDHGAIDDLTQPGSLSFQEGTHDSEGG